MSDSRAELPRRHLPHRGAGPFRMIDSSRRYGRCMIIEFKVKRRVREIVIVNWIGGWSNLGSEEIIA
jgi:hypothetical protein